MGWQILQLIFSRGCEKEWLKVIKKEWWSNGDLHYYVMVAVRVVFLLRWWNWLGLKGGVVKIILKIF